jgi:hypothetical protein
MALDEPVIVAVAALAGSLVGACSSVAATFIGQRLQARWAQLRTELEERERLYGIFVEEIRAPIRRFDSKIGDRAREHHAALFKGGAHPPRID